MKAFISDCEGPISKNDNAYELTSSFVSDGEKLFSTVSKYDDVLAYLLRREGYKAGNTLKLILPFLKTFGVTDQKMQEFSARTLLLIPDIRDALHHVKTLAHTFIVSTSYEHYIRALCKTVDFPYENTYCTRLLLDNYPLKSAEKAKLKMIAKEIIEMPTLEISEAKSAQDLSERDRNTIKRLAEIFWDEIANMSIGRIYKEVEPVGGSEKAEAIQHITAKLGITLSDVMYVGDSITDVEAFGLVKKHGGLAVSFNGNRYAIENAEIAVLSENGLVTAVIADVFCRFGKQQTLRLVENWNYEALSSFARNKSPLDDMVKRVRGLPSKVEKITRRNVQVLSKESSDFRKKVRGESVGRLG